MVRQLQEITNSLAMPDPALSDKPNLLLRDWQNGPLLPTGRESC